MMLNRDIKGLILLLILVGFTLSLIIFLSLFSNAIQLDNKDFQDDIIPQHYNLEFIDHLDYMICHVKIFFQLTQNRYQFSIVKSIDHTVDISSINLEQKQLLIPIHSRINDDQIIITKNQWKKIFHFGNYSISMMTHINISNTIKTSFIRQIWASKYRILFPNNHPLFPHLPHSFHRPTFNMNIITSDLILSNLPLNQISSAMDISQIGFALLNEYECRSLDILQLCFPINSSDLFSYIFNYTLNAMPIFESYFSRKFPLSKLTLIPVLELNQRVISKPGLVFIDQNALLTNLSAEQILQQRELIFFILAYQWIDTLIQFDKDQKWFGESLARSIANHLFGKINEPMGNNNSQIERFMSTIVIDSLCNTELSRSENNSIEKGEAFLTEYRLHIGDIQFQSQMQQLITTTFFNLSDLSSFLTWSTISGHPIVIFNSSTIDIHSFKFNSNCSTSIPPIHPITYRFLNDSSLVSAPLNPFIHISYPSWKHLIDELKLSRQQQFNTISKLLFDSFLFNLANQLSIEYPLQLLNIFFQQSLSSLTKTDLLILNKILQWYRSILPNSLEEKFVNFLRKHLNPFCTNQLWTRQILTDMKSHHQQIINDILLELCCSINHSVCLQQISNRNDPQILIQFIFNNQRFNLTPTKSMQIDMLTSFNQLQIPSLFIYPDRIITSIICQTVRQQNEKYWYDLIHSIQQKFQYQVLPSSIITGLSCSIRTLEQMNFYLNNLCPPSPFKWPCYRNIVTYSSIKNFEQLKTIDSEQWPRNNDELVDFLFHVGTIQANFSSHPIILEFQSLIFTWLTTNQNEFLHWLDHENNQNAYFI